MVAAASEEGGVVTNGMSQYSRNERNANSAIVLGITPELDYPGDPLAGIDLQRALERQAFAQIGITRECMGNPNEYSTTEGIKVGITIHFGVEFKKSSIASS